MTQTISSSLRQAYQQTDYLFIDIWTIKTRDHTPDIITRLSELGIDTFAIITAYNPYSHHTTDEQNISNNQQLQQVIISKGYKYLIGEWKDPSWQRPSEPSFLIINIDLDQAKERWSQYGQNAIVRWDTKHATLIQTL